ncbi:hypothetical protein GCWU000341_01696 [Oribacterium sp. oral taxon 078 str. F0262]|nr:hypothetical protein GCWU000341_01696 [Oribacterium sp. oral taxon 078 str. F0262]
MLLMLQSASYASSGLFSRRLFIACPADPRAGCLCPGISLRHESKGYGNRSKGSRIGPAGHFPQTEVHRVRRPT